MFRIVHKKIIIEKKFKKSMSDCINEALLWNDMLIVFNNLKKIKSLNYKNQIIIINELEKCKNKKELRLIYNKWLKKL